MWMAFHLVTIPDFDMDPNWRFWKGKRVIKLKIYPDTRSKKTGVAMNTLQGRSYKARTMTLCYFDRQWFVGLNRRTKKKPPAELGIWSLNLRGVTVNKTVAVASTKHQNPLHVEYDPNGHGWTFSGLLQLQIRIHSHSGSIQKNIWK